VMAALGRFRTDHSSRSHKSEEVLDTLTKPRREGFVRLVAIGKTLKPSFSNRRSPREDLAEFGGNGGLSLSIGARSILAIS
jgi:hypothetical protein